MARLRLFIPLIVFALLAMLLYVALSLDPARMPSALIDKAFPDFELAELHKPEQRLTKQDFPAETSLVNVWASWCYACRIEHPYLTRLSKQYQVPLVGLNYKDKVPEGRRWLQEFGNPYVFNISDLDGRLGLDLGVFGAPETFVVDASGMIRYKHVGVVDDRVWETDIWPLIQTLRQQKLDAASDAVTNNTVTNNAMKGL